MKIPRRYRRRLITIGLLLVLCLLYKIAPEPFQTTAKSIETNQPGLYSINHFVDGDTIAVDMNGHSETIRFIGIDTPETHKPNTPVQCFGPQAAAYTESQIKTAGSKVRLVADALTTDRDRYGRLLRYVYLPDGSFLQAKLISSGHAFYYPYFPFSKAASFDQAEQQAISQKRGLWAACRPTPSDDGGYKMDEPQPDSLGTTG